MQVTNPYNNQIIGEVQLITDVEVEQIINNAVTAYSITKAMSGFAKHQLLTQIANLLNERISEFTACIIEESAKPHRYAKGEVERAIETFRIAAEESLRLPHEIMPLDRTAKAAQLVGEYKYFPSGVIFGISPFNFPLNLAVHKIAPAIAAGCPIILKPSSRTPLVMKLLAETINQTNLPPHAFQVVNCSRETGDLFIQSPKIAVISFTGSPEVGWDIKNRSGKKKTILELGGNAAAIVCEDATIPDAVNELLIGSFAYSGQVCIHAQRIYIHKSQFDFFSSQFVAKAKGIRSGDPKDPATEFSVMIDENNAIRVENWVEEAIQLGANLIIGGKRQGSYFPPTILSNVNKSSKIRNEEVFGPVVILEEFETIEQAVNEVNDSRFGLQASIFTNSICIRDYCYENLEVGGVIHNYATTFRVDQMPYGGIKDSGFGREGVFYTIRDYMEGKLLVRRG